MPTRSEYPKPATKTYTARRTDGARWENAQQFTARGSRLSASSIDIGAIAGAVAAAIAGAEQSTPRPRESRTPGSPISSRHRVCCGRQANCRANQTRRSSRLQSMKRDRSGGGDAEDQRDQTHQQLSPVMDIRVVTDKTNQARLSQLGCQLVGGGQASQLAFNSQGDTETPIQWCEQQPARQAWHHDR